MKSLQDIIRELIELKQEGAYWDFKRQWYGKSKNDDMLHVEKFHFEEIINAKGNCDRLSGKW